MAVSVVLHFPKTEDATSRYDTIVDEMGVQDNPAPGSVYHWCAPTTDGGLLICDVWETKDDFERFSQEQIVPLTRKHDVPAPEIEFDEVYKTLNGNGSSRKGVGVVVEVAGDPDELLRQYDEANAKMGVRESPPQGLIFHCSMKTPKGFRAIDHWASRNNFDRFVQTELGKALQEAGMPQPQIAFYDVHNTIDARTAARI